MTYQEFIDNILNTRGRFNCGDVYHERHHILPRCCGGTNDEFNLIDLYAREHCIAHRLLAEENPTNISLVKSYVVTACVRLPTQHPDEISEEDKLSARLFASKMLKELFKDKTNHPNYGKHLSESTRRKIGIGNMGNKKCVGRVLSEETKRKIGNANRNPSTETRNKMSASQKIAQSGDKNSRARKVIRISDGKVYTCGKYAAIENGINYSTFKAKIQRNIGDYMYLDEWKTLNEING